MLKIGAFSKLSMLTVKTLRYYEREGLLSPAAIDPATGYRLYETAQLEAAARIKAMRQLDFSVAEIRAYLGGAPLVDVLGEKARELTAKQTEIASMLSVIQYLSEEKNMEYQAVIKTLPACTVYSEERTLPTYGDLTALVMESAEECLRLNPGIKCVQPDYCFVEYPDGEYRESNFRARYSQAVTAAGNENERIRFRHLPSVEALCVYHKGSYDRLGEAYAYLMNYAQANGYTISGLPRECYIDGVWNKEDPAEYLTEIELPVTVKGA